MPANPCVDASRPYSAMLDRARQLRLALADMPDVPAVLAATAALSDEECRMVVLEIALDSLWQRRRGS